MLLILKYFGICNGFLNFGTMNRSSPYQGENQAKMEEHEKNVEEAEKKKSKPKWRGAGRGRMRKYKKMLTKRCG